VSSGVKDPELYLDAFAVKCRYCKAQPFTQWVNSKLRLFCNTKGCPDYRKYMLPDHWKGRHTRCPECRQRSGHKMDCSQRYKESKSMAIKTQRQTADEHGLTVGTIIEHEDYYEDGNWERFVITAIGDHLVLMRSVDEKPDRERTWHRHESEFRVVEKPESLVEQEQTEPETSLGVMVQIESRKQRRGILQRRFRILRAVLMLLVLPGIWIPFVFKPEDGYHWTAIFAMVWFIVISYFMGSVDTDRRHLDEGRK